MSQRWDKIKKHSVHLFYCKYKKMVIEEPPNGNDKAIANEEEIATPFGPQ